MKKNLLKWLFVLLLLLHLWACWSSKQYHISYASSNLPLDAVIEFSFMQPYDSFFVEGWSKTRTRFKKTPQTEKGHSAAFKLFLYPIENTLTMGWKGIYVFTYNEYVPKTKPELAAKKGLAMGIYETDLDKLTLHKSISGQPLSELNRVIGGFSTCTQDYEKKLANFSDAFNISLEMGLHPLKDFLTLENPINLTLLASDWKIQNGITIFGKKESESQTAYLPVTVSKKQKYAVHTNLVLSPSNKFTNSFLTFLEVNEDSTFLKQQYWQNEQVLCLETYPHSFWTKNFKTAKFHASIYREAEKNTHKSLIYPFRTCASTTNRAIYDFLLKHSTTP